MYCSAGQTALLSCDRGKSHDACSCVLEHFLCRAFTSAGEAGDVQQPDAVAEHRFLNAQGGPVYLKESVLVVVFPSFSRRVIESLLALSVPL